MKVLLSVLLAVVLVLGLGIPVVAQELSSDPGIVVLGEPLVIGPQQTLFFAWTVEEEADFLFTWNSGDLRVSVRDENEQLVQQFDLWSNSRTRAQRLTAGEYILQLSPWSSNWMGDDHSVTITMIPPPPAVVLGEPLVIGPQETQLFTFAAQEDSYFLFSWNSGDARVTVRNANNQIVRQMDLFSGNPMATLSLEAGEYTVQLSPWSSAWTGGDHSVTITEADPPPPPPPPPTTWETFRDVVLPGLLGLAVALLIAVAAFLPLWWLGMNV